MKRLYKEQFFKIGLYSLSVAVIAVTAFYGYNQLTHHDQIRSRQIAGKTIAGETPCLEADDRCISSAFSSLMKTGSAISESIEIITRSATNIYNATNIHIKCRHANTLSKEAEKLNFGLELSMAFASPRIAAQIASIEQVLLNKVKYVIDGVPGGVGPQTAGSANFKSADTPLSTICGNYLQRAFNHLEYSIELDRRSDEIANIMDKYQIFR